MNLKAFRNLSFLYSDKTLDSYWLKLVLAILILFVLSSVIFLLTQRDDPKFCTLEDELYQNIHANYQEWIDFYRSRFESTEFPKESITIRTSNYGRPYVVNSSIWSSPSEPPQFFVVVETSLTERTFGKYGYIYSDGGQLSSSWLRIQPLGANIYCYWVE